MTDCFDPSDLTGLAVPPNARPIPFDYELVCADGVPAFRHEIRFDDGTSTVTFIGLDGVAVTPATWFPGACDGKNYDHELICDVDPVTGEVFGMFSWLLIVDQGTTPPTFTWTSVTPGTGAAYTPIGVPRFCASDDAPTTVAEMWCLTDAAGATRPIQATKLIPASGATPTLTFYDIDPATGALSPLVLAAGDELSLGPCVDPVIRSVLVCAIVDRAGTPTDEQLIAHYAGVDPNTTVYFTDLDGVAVPTALVTPVACCFDSTTKAVEWVCESDPATGATRPLEVVKVIDKEGAVIGQRYFTILGVETVVAPGTELSAGPCGNSYDAERICATVDRSATGGSATSSEEVIAHYSGVWPNITAVFTDLDGSALDAADVTPVACCSSYIATDWVCWDNNGTPTSLEAVRVFSSNGDLLGSRFYTVDGVEVPAPAAGLLTAGTCPAECPPSNPVGVVTAWAQFQ